MNIVVLVAAYALIAEPGQPLGFVMTRFTRDAVMRPREPLRRDVVSGDGGARG
jgi:hypothetical protein